MTSKHAKTDRFDKAAQTAAAAERIIQKNIDRKESRRRKTNKKTGAMQAGARRYPTPPVPKQHIAKPGKEALLDLAPMYDAPHYKGSEKLKDKVALITGGSGECGRARTGLDPAQSCRSRRHGRGKVRRRHADEAAGAARGNCAAFVFLAAPSCSSYITGEILPMIGGYSGG